LAPPFYGRKMEISFIGWKRTVLNSFAILLAVTIIAIQRFISILWRRQNNVL